MKRKSQFKENSTKLLNKSTDLKVSKISKDETLFEFGEIITTDLAEGIAIMLINKDFINHKIWKTKITENIEKIEPRRALYWLSGGDREWLTLENYNQNWIECGWDFQERFGLTLMDILKKSNTYEDIRNGFIKKLNLSLLYDFALSKKLVR